MENEINKESTSKVRNNKFKLILIIVIALIVFVLVLIFFKHFFTRNNSEIISGNNPENIIEETDSSEILYVPTEKLDADDIEIDKNVVQEPTNSVEPSDGSATTPPVNNSDANTSSHPPVNSNTNTGSDNNNGNNNPTDNETSSTPAAPVAPAKPYVVKTENSTELTKSETKYGVIINTYTTYTYDIYSDGSKKATNSSNKIEYDKSNYHASTSELLPEARSAKNQYNSMLTQVFNNVNSYRNEANNNFVNSVSNRNNLILNENLCVAACARAMEMAYSSKFSHTRPNGSQCFTILKEMGISYMTAGENIAQGYSSADAVSAGWKNSQGHYANMISPDFSQLGVGVFELEGVYYWVQLFN